MNSSLLVWGASGSLFILGAAFLVLRRQLIAMIIGLELMINAANLNIVAYAARRGDAAGLAAAMLVIAAAAAEAVVGLSLILNLLREEGAAESDRIRELSG
ncbi:MAG: NADH-quinone oxidoreductase subunit NuoK [Elusimicrobia bacterium]|nr:NADH-quinone oxidoreductase subunit NuoK [Elusimicrobiota bacterium]